MTEHQRSHPDPNPVRPSQAEGGDDEDDMDEEFDTDMDSPDPHSNRPSQAEGEDY
jgi:hypothetical protein